MMFVEQGNDGSLRKEAFVHLVHQNPRGAESERAWTTKLDADHQAAPANFFEELKARRHRSQAFANAVSQKRSIFHQVVTVDDIESRQSSGHRPLRPDEKCCA